MLSTLVVGFRDVREETRVGARVLLMVSFRLPPPLVMWPLPSSLAPVLLVLLLLRVTRPSDLMPGISLLTRGGGGVEARQGALGERLGSRAVHALYCLCVLKMGKEGQNSDENRKERERVRKHANKFTHVRATPAPRPRDAEVREIKGFYTINV